MSLLLNWLEKFNSKERFFLVGYALGNSRFALGEQFCADISEKLHIPVHRDAFVAMDYHFDWLSASLHLAANGICPESSPERYPQILEVEDKEGWIHGNQEDIDLLIAFDQADKIGTEIILLEAKGVTAWSNNQMESKAKRLGQIFGFDEYDPKRWNGVRPYFAITSPKESISLKNTDWPKWMKRDGQILQIELPIRKAELRHVTRCGKNANGIYEHWTWSKR